MTGLRGVTHDLPATKAQWILPESSWSLSAGIREMVQLFLYYCSEVIRFEASENWKVLKNMKSVLHLSHLVLITSGIIESSQSTPLRHKSCRIQAGQKWNWRWRGFLFLCKGGLSMLYEIGMCLTEYTTDHWVLIPWLTCQDRCLCSWGHQFCHWDILYDLLLVGNELLQVETSSSAHFFNRLDQMVFSPQSWYRS